LILHVRDLELRKQRLCCLRPMRVPQPALSDLWAVLSLRLGWQLPQMVEALNRARGKNAIAQGGKNQPVRGKVGYNWEEKDRELQGGDRHDN